MALNSSSHDLNFANAITIATAPRTDMMKIAQFIARTSIIHLDQQIMLRLGDGFSLASLDQADSFIFRL
jgi:hypothetical protein